MKKIKYLLLFYILIYNFNIMCLNFYKTNDYFLIISNPDLKEIRSYWNNDLFYIYQSKQVNNQKQFSLIPKKSKAELFYINIENDKNSIKIIGFDNKNNKILSLLYIVNNGLVEKKVSEDLFRGDDTANSSRWIKIIEEYEYNNQKLVKQFSNGKILREILYNGDKINSIIYYIDNDKKVENYNYSNDTDYECYPSYDFWLSNKQLAAFINKKIHYEKKENNKKVIIDEYYGDYFDKKRILLFQTKHTILKDRVVSWETYDGINNQMHKYEYIYANGNVGDNINIYFTPIVNNLRLRELDNQNSKVIRLLAKGEKLEFIEQGKEETIDGVKGNWVKVKTEKGEVGWCFDAYLEEVR